VSSTDVSGEGAGVDAGTDAAPVGEEIHLPGPTALPLINAFGIALTLVGILLGLGLVIAGGVIFLWSLVVWIRHTMRDVDELPREHG
jgi:hypothetical protein